MKISIKRFNKEIDAQAKIEEFEIKESITLLEAFEEIKVKLDSTLSYRCACKSGVCGSCAVRVNGVEKLACKTSINENDFIEALKNSKVIKDLVVDLSHEKKLLKNSHAFLHKKSDFKIEKKDEKVIDTQSNCILCQSCYSSCPIYEVNNEFLGPYALTRALRYVDDKKEAQSIKILENIQSNGIWDCTLCGNCTFVCPQFIDPKTDIMKLRMKSVQNGFEDRSLEAFGDFNLQFNDFDNGFNPNGGFNPNNF